MKPQLLENYLTEFKNQDVYFCIELKTGRFEEVQMAWDLVKKLEMEDQVAIGVAHTSLVEARKQVGNFTSFFDKKNIMRLMISFFCGNISLSYKSLCMC